jgi:hypothetical protein
MPCLLLILVLAFPRVVLALLFFFTNYLDRAYQGFLLPLIGFIFLPLTTLVYAWITNNNRPMDTTSLVILVVAVLIDAGGLGGGWNRRNR